MEYIVAFFCAFIVFAYIYGSALRKDIKLQQIEIKLIEMDDKMEKFVIGAIEKLQEDVTNLRVEVGKIKTQAAIYSGIVFGLLTVITEVIKKI